MPSISNVLFIDGMRIPAENRIGEEGGGFRAILHGMNPERILIGAGAVGIGRAALARAARYARERIVFGRPIGQNQSIAHPLARSWAELEAAQLMVLRAAALYDARQDCGAEANAAKYLAAEAGFRACEAAVMTHGGMGYAREFHVERYLREIMIPRIAPVSPQMILNFIAERVLGLPKLVPEMAPDVSGTEARWQPLRGVRVADCTSPLRGPFATLARADLGADVVEAEPPGAISRAGVVGGARTETLGETHA